MNLKTAGLILATLLVAACGRQQTNSDGNGPGKADGAGGREDPPAAPATDPGQPATSGEPASGTAEPPATQPQE